jgi:flagellar biosynthesis protein FlhA
VAQAGERRAQVEREADFYGAMDGASKFVRGDAIAGLIITAVNLIGGLLIGVGQQNLAAGDAAAIYGLLAIGDGLTSQIPALLVSTAAGVVITRTASRDELGSEILSQLSQKQRGSRIVAGLLFAMGFVPGMPTLILWGLSGLAFWLSRGRTQAPAAEAAPPPPAAAPENPEALREMLPVDTLELELGYSLVRLVEKDADGDLLGRIRAIRRQFAMDQGFVVPPIHIRDNLRLPPDLYRVLLRGAEIGRGRIVPDRLMAMAPAQPAEVIAGQPGVEPAFGIEVVWISADQRSRAERAGYTVVDGSTVIATHLTELVRRHAAELLGRSEVQDLLEVVARRSPKLVEDLIPGALTLAEVTRVLRLLLAEGVSIRDLATILETLAEEAGRTRDPAMLCELVRARLAPSICQKAADEEGRLHAIFLDPAAERLVRERLLPGERGGALSLDLEEIRNWTRQIQEFTAAAPVPPLLVVPGDLRRALSDLLRRFMPALSVLSLHEVQTRAEVRTVGLLRASERRMPAGAPAAPSLSPNRAAAPAR